MGHFKMPNIKASNYTPELNMTKTYSEQHHQLKKETILHASAETQLEILELLKQQAESSKQESLLAEKRHKTQTRRFIISTIIGVLTLLAAVVIPLVA